MKGIILVAFVAASLCVVSALPGVHDPTGYYQANYGFLASGYGGHPHYDHGNVANVHAVQNGHSYNYGLNENGAHYTKTVHQSRTFNPTFAGYGIQFGHPAY